MPVPRYTYLIPKFVSLYLWTQEDAVCTDWKAYGSEADISPDFLHLLKLKLPY